ncbi:Ig-like domain-containing protein [Butyrivibrio sp. MB2005]|uniref:Ig-like domain-containing protein n=1 Tax=Butyrivibrio sp. MB2005 TaxID=1280678 RepID=UPI0003F9A749|nr:Ig-like domain-containing protein [Butyrivibrio sp. MB2005]
MKKIVTKMLLWIAAIMLFLAFPQNANAASKVKLEKKTVTLKPGDSYKIKLKNVPKGAKVKMSCKADNNYVTVSKKGIVKAKDYPGKKSKISVNVKVKTKGKTKKYKFAQIIKIKKGDESYRSDENGNSSITLPYRSINIRKGETEFLDADTNPSYESVTWSSNNTRVASITKNGLLKGESIGSAIITATIKNGKSASCVVNVTSPQIKKIKIVLPKDNIEEGESIIAKAEIEPADASGEIVWNANNDCVKIDGHGDTVTITGIEAGRAYITAKDGVVSSISKTLTVVPKNNVFGKNQTWESPNKWRLTITDVKIHSSCSGASNAKGEEIVAISYTYENLGVSEGLFINITDRNCYDSQGYPAENYYCSHFSYPKMIAVGTKYSASRAVVLKHKGNELSIKMPRYSFNGQGQAVATFNIPYGKTEAEETTKTISFDKVDMALYMNETGKFNVSTTSTEDIIWASQDMNVAKVDSKTGEITPVGPGMTTIYALQGTAYAQGIVRINPLKITFLDHGNNLSKLRVMIENTSNKSIGGFNQYGFGVNYSKTSKGDLLYINGDMLSIDNEIPAGKTVTYTLKRPSLSGVIEDTTPIRFTENANYLATFDYNGEKYIQSLIDGTLLSTMSN